MPRSALKLANCAAPSPQLRRYRAPILGALFGGPLPGRALTRIGMRTFYVALHLEKPDEPLHGAHPAQVRPEGVSMREPGPGLARSYLIEEDVYLSKEWQKTKLGEKHIKARDVGSRWERMNLPGANFLHHGNLWVFTDEATARKIFDGTSSDEWSMGKGVRP
jgi:hypothetical protein